MHGGGVMEIEGANALLLKRVVFELLGAEIFFCVRCGAIALSNTVAQTDERGSVLSYLVNDKDRIFSYERRSIDWI